MTDEQRQAEQLDEEVLGQDVVDDPGIGVANFPPERPRGVEDPSILQGGSGTEDDLVTRDWRHAGGDDGTDRGTRLLPSDGNTVEHDEEAAAIADAAIEVADAAPEETAMRVVDPLA